MLEDDPEQSELMRLWLEDAEHTVVTYASGNEFLRAVRRDSFDLYILDWVLPDISGIDVLIKLRSEHNDRTPALISTARQQEQDIVRALECGADDYLVKPIRQRELIARVAAILRRTTNTFGESASYDADPYAMDLGSKTASLRGKSIALTNREFELALFLFRHAGQAVSRAHMLEAIWDIDNENVTTRTVDTHISRLRKKMALCEDNGWKLSAIYQHGYRLEKVGAESNLATSQ